MRKASLCRRCCCCCCCCRCCSDLESEALLFFFSKARHVEANVSVFDLFIREVFAFNFFFWGGEVCKRTGILSFVCLFPSWKKKLLCNAIIRMQFWKEKNIWNQRDGHLHHTVPHILNCICLTLYHSPQYDTQENSSLHNNLFYSSAPYYPDTHTTFLLHLLVSVKPYSTGTITKRQSLIFSGAIWNL